MARQNVGFTIVELLIVIVVIAILAAISVVAYRGVQNRAYDSVVESDVSNFVKKIREYEAINGSIPTPGSSLDHPNATTFPGIKFAPSKDSYSTTYSNLYYCAGTKSGKSTFTIAAQSKAQNRITYRPDEGMVKVAAHPALLYTNCRSGFDVDTDGYSYGYHVVNGWYSWTNGE